MPRALVLLVGVVVGGAAAALVVLGVRMLVGTTTLGITERALACDDSERRLCVVRLSRPELLAVPGKREIQVRYDGVPRALYAGDPFVEEADNALEVDFTDGVTVRGRSYALHWDSGRVASLLTD